MPKPLNGFLWVFCLTLLFGLLVGTLNLMNPEAVHIPFGVDEQGNPQSAEGLDGILASLASSAVLGIVFGSLAFIFAWMFRAGVSKTYKPPNVSNTQDK